jgi:hypothetical protein
MFSPHVEGEIRRVAAERRIEAAALLAVAEIESGGQALVDVDGRVLPPILFEYHVFHRRLRAAQRPAAVAGGLAAPRWGQIRYPRSQRERYALLERAKLIDREAAYASCSWGVGQVLGDNASWLGYASAEALAEEAMAGVAGQVALMLRFVERRGLRDSLETRDWTAFAAGYNGPSHARHDYAGRLARAYAAWAARAPAPVEPTPLGVGAAGERVLAVQRLLCAAGACLSVDGAFGRQTRAAVLAFQAAEGLVCDGIVGRATMARLIAAGGAPA